MMNIELVSNVLVTEIVELDDGVILDYSEHTKIVSSKITGVKKRVLLSTLEALSFTVVRAG
jgi:uncharacterized protein YuzE